MYGVGSDRQGYSKEWDADDADKTQINADKNRSDSRQDENQSSRPDPV
jgi:hypothetical protein